MPAPLHFTHSVSPRSHPGGLHLTHVSALSARGVVVLLGLLAFWQLGPGLPELLPHCISHPNCQERMFSGPRRTFQISVTGGATYLIVREASLCHQKAGAFQCNLSNGAQGQDGKAAASWSCLSMQCRAGPAKLRQGFLTSSDN